MIGLARSSGRPDASVARGVPGRRTLRLYLVKPSKYDDRDGTVLRYRWGVIPSNTLTVLAGINAEYARSRPAIAMQTVLWDEMLDGVLAPDVVASIADRARDDGVEAIVALAGVQTNQYPRARDIALECLSHGIRVLAGGFHLSSHAPSREFLVSIGATVAVGEAEDFWPRMMDDLLRGALAPGYSVADGIRARTGSGTVLVPPIDATPLPRIEPRYLTRFFNHRYSTVDTSRGCPFACSYCAVKDVMGRTMRARDPSRVVEWVRDAHDRHGINGLFLVDDDLFRSPRCEELLRGLAGLRRSGRPISFMMQADVEASFHASRDRDEPESERHRRSRRFVDLAAEAGCYVVFVGFESFDPANLEAARKFHNQPGARGERAERSVDRVKEKYAIAVREWHRAGIAVHGGYMIGFPHDGPGCGRAAARNLVAAGVDIVSFFVNTPAPGTEDFAAAERSGAILDRDFNAYDSQHAVAVHPLLTPAQIEREYVEAQQSFYSWRRLAWSLATLHRVPGLSMSSRIGMVAQDLYITYAYRRGWHPMLGGIWRIRDRSVRRGAVSDAEALAGSRIRGAAALRCESSSSGSQAVAR